VHAYFLLRELTPLVGSEESAGHYDLLNQTGAKLTALGLGGLVQSHPNL
jgi:hypothetical protein